MVAQFDFDCRGSWLRVSMCRSLTTQSKTEPPAESLARACPVCLRANAEPFWHKGELRIVRCLACDMVYVNPAPAGMASGDFYNTEGAAYYLSPAKLASDYAPVRYARELRLFREFCSRGRVLDAGCGSGGFLFQLRQRWPHAYELLGTDVSGAPLDYAESRGVAVARGSFLEQHFGDCPFDAITLWAVVEHLACPRAFLEKAHALLKPGGVCFVLVPNLRSLAVRLLGVKYRYVYSQHLNYFTATTLKQLGETVGFEIVTTRFTHFNPLVIWQDGRGGGREVSNAERGALLQQTTAYKQRWWLAPARWAYGLTERTLGALGLADNVVAVLRKGQGAI
ncbi:MAG: class I SAM-dependent methyltransferase [Verrucomicrobiae bacterium]|nr:class I SAM-dependent methyltransferase [Verrucomicrobiae bacterium]